MEDKPLDDPEKPETEPTRRDVLDQILGAGAVVWVAGTVIPASVYLWPAGSRGPGSEYAEAGSVTDFPVGSERMIQKDGKPVMVIRTKEDEFHALSAVCTHLACIVQWDPDARQIRCPCHAGFFAPDGTVIAGPPPRPLTPLRVVVVNDEVRVYA
jgi:cytochrome b6-f complex iron-sulfur subunit